MNAEERLRELKDPDRWTNVRLPHPRDARVVTVPGRGAHPRASLVAAFVLVLAAIGGLYYGLSSLRPGSGPAAPSGVPSAPAPARSPSPTVTPAASACALGALTIRRDGATGGATGNWVQQLVVHNAGGACVLPASAFAVGARHARGGRATEFLLKAGSSSTLDLFAPTTCEAGAANLNPKGPFTSLTVSIGGHTRAIETFPQLRCADPFIDQF